MRLDLWPDHPDAHAREIAAFFEGTLTSPRAVLMAVDDRGGPVGFAELSIRRYVDGCDTDRVAYLEGWYVDPDRRRRGVGRALVDAAERWARAQGSTEFGSDALLHNELSAAAHRALGFEETEQIRYFRKVLGGEPASPDESRGPADGLDTLMSARRGHFVMESGLHAGTWLDLDPLFTDSRRIDPYVASLAGRLRRYDLDVVCGALVGGAFLAQLIARALGTDFWFSELHPAHDDAVLTRRYRLPRSFASRAAGTRVAIVDDVMSAGSALRGTYAALAAEGAVPVAAAALIVLGTNGNSFFSERGVPVETLVRREFEMWTPTECPLCARGEPIDRTSDD
jgi:orotate phosphoribosyltransferase/GNAT superfamily N-acetyltransferase